MTHHSVVFRQPPDIFLTASVSKQYAGTYVHSEFGHLECAPPSDIHGRNISFQSYIGSFGSQYTSHSLLDYKFYMKGEFLYETRD